MATLTKTAVICSTEEEFTSLTQFRQVVDVSEFYRVTTLSSLTAIDGLTNVIYLSSGKTLSEIADIRAKVLELGVSQKWQ